MQSCILQERTARRKPRSAVVVARDQQYREAAVPAEGGHGIVVQVDRIGTGYRMVKDIPRDHHRIHLLGTHRFQQTGNHLPLVLQQGHTMQRDAQMPV